MTDKPRWEGIVKFQRPLGGNHEGNPMLIYNEDHSIEELLDDDEVFQQLFSGHCEPKVYHECVLDADGILQINERVEEQSW